MKKLIGLCLSLFISGCGAGTHSANTDPSNSGSGLEQGRQLYTIHCQRCHNDFDHTERRGVSIEEITHAIGTVSRMSHLSILTEEEIAAISFALNN